MFNRSFISILIVTSAFTLIFGQTPESKKEKEATPQAFAWSFDGEGGYLGVQTTDVSKENYAKFGLREVRGVAVEKVLENSPASAAGIQNGDVIVRFNGEEVTSARKLSRLISEVAPDHQVTLTVLRGGKEQTVTATLGKHQSVWFENGNFNFATPGPMGNWNLENLDKLKEMPQFKEFKLPDMKEMPNGEMPQIFSIPGGEGRNFVWQAGGGRQMGVSVYSVTKQLGERFGVDGGVMINEVRDGSPAAKAGLKAGDIIVEVNGKAVKGDFDLIRTINERKEGDVTLTIVRDRNKQTITVTPEASKDGGFWFKSDVEDGVQFTPQPSTIRPTAIPSAPTTTVRPGRIL